MKYYITGVIKRAWVETKKHYNNDNILNIHITDNNKNMKYIMNGNDSNRSRKLSGLTPLFATSMILILGNIFSVKSTDILKRATHLAK